MSVIPNKYFSNSHHFGGDKIITININSKRLSFLIVVTIFISINILIGSVVAVPQEEWNKTYGGSYYDIAYSVQQTLDGGYIITGSTSSYGAGGNDVYLIKTDASGNELWNKTFGGGNYDAGFSVKQTSDAGYIITGSSISSGSGSDVYQVKTDASGSKQWDKTLGGINYDTGFSVQQTSEGGYIISGITSSYGAGNGDMYLIKTDVSGNELWNKTYGGSYYDDSRSVQQTSDGGYIITGSTSSYGADGNDVYLIKTDDSGNELWNKTFGGSNYDAGYSVQQTTDGGYIIAGVKYSYNNGSHDVWLIKVSSNGELRIIRFPCENCGDPYDTDGDGLYEDINGNGRIDFNDVIIFYDYLEWVSSNEPISNFDFNGNGRIDFNDIIKLFEEL